MGNAYCAIKYEFAGKPYETVHSVHSGVSTAGGQTTFTDDDLTQWGFYELSVGDLEVRTDPTHAQFDPKSLIEAIIGYHVAMHGPLVRLTQVYVNDGFTLGDPTGNFATFDLNLFGKNTNLGSTLANYAPGNNALMIDKASGQFSRRGGRSWMRGCLPLASIMPSAEDGVTLTDAGRLSATLVLNTYLTQQPLTAPTPFSGYFGTGQPGLGTTPVSVQYSIGRTLKVLVNGKERRVLDNWTQVSTLSVDDAQSRDTRRRNKKAVGTP